ncbi:hypothetical protein BFF78_00370 [Streptomyces fodineus]|uniref:Pentapeptide repeat-containing protein n=1 Tax=Streptomyces fodineus TaxID=1904616 RepID=A0A1D7Y2S7_9ACTN|nr:pentapeptide repeat-containing protein [Streptomyces fodineus]AOR29750.1 hypothetical protein BFF78_00370 [Streptomyces fodineus]
MLATMALGLAVLWVLAPVLYAGSGAKPDAQATASATTRAGILAVFAAAIATLGAVLSLAETRRANLATHEREREAQVTDRYTKAIGQLGEADEDKVAVRLGGIYALERIAEDSPRDRPTVLDVLCAFVRHRGRGPADGSPESLKTHRPPADVQAAATVIGRLSRADAESERINLSEAHLERVNLFEARFTQAMLAHAHLEGAWLTGVHFEEASLIGAHLEGATLDGAHLEGATLTGTHLKGATMYGAWLAGASLREADLERANLTGAWLPNATLSAGGALDVETGQWRQFEGARLHGTHLKDAQLQGTHLEGVDLSHVRGLTQSQLGYAHGDEATLLPEGLTRPASWNPPDEPDRGQDSP